MLSLPIKRPASAPPAERVQRKGEGGSRSLGDCGRKPPGHHRALEIGAADDPLEREADRAADSVLAGGGGSDFSQIPVAVQRHGAAPGPGTGIAPTSVHRTLAEPGRPLDAAVRRDLEPRFGRDFSQVRIHDDAAAGESARAIGAAAYTVANDIVFRQGRFDPATPAGLRLLAHELAHVAQQQGTAGPVVARRSDATGGGTPSGDGGAQAPASASVGALSEVTFGAISFQGSANRIPPTRSVDVPVTVTGLPSGTAVAIDIEGDSEPANGVASITAGAELSGSGIVTVRGRAQTMAGNAGALKLRARLGEATLGRSDGFTIAAYPINFTDTLNDPIHDKDVVGMVVDDCWESDGSGAIDELGEVMISERVVAARQDPPFKLGTSITSFYERAQYLSKDVHSYPKKYIDIAGLGFGTWEMTYHQLSLFKCARTGQTDLIMPNSGFIITLTVSRLSPAASAMWRMTKVGAAVVVEGRSATAGKALITTGDQDF